jgi:hypothetical protein
VAPDFWRVTHFFANFFFLSQKKKILKKKIFRSNNNFPLGLNINRAVKKDDWAVYKRQHFEGKKQKAKKKLFWWKIWTDSQTMNFQD